MASIQPDQDTPRFTAKATAESHFSWLRTRLSVERTLMAWVRTSVSLIAFGFTIVQFFDRMKGFEGVAAARFPDAPRFLGMAMILCGVIGLIVSIWQYRWTIRYLRSNGFETIAGLGAEPLQTPLYGVVIALALIGIFAFFAVLLRLT